jgi:hypothetical protein
MLRRSKSCRGSFARGSFVNVKSGELSLSFASDEEGGEWVEGEGQLSSLRHVHARKLALIKRLDKAGL